MDDAVPEDAGRLLHEVCRHVASLLADMSAAKPRRLSLRAGAIAVEVEWPEVTETRRQITPELVTVPADPGTAADAAASADGNGASRDGDGVFYVRAATVGTFYRAPEPGARPFATEGERVRPGQQLGILEAMKMMLPVESDRAGLVAGFLVDDAMSVEFDTPLVMLRLEDA